MAKAKKKSKKRGRVSRSGAGSFCVSSTRPGSGGKGLAFQVVCYKTQDAAIRAIPTRMRGAYNAMIYKKRAR